MGNPNSASSASSCSISFLSPVVRPMTKCLVALGSNLGDRAATLDAAIRRACSGAGCRVGAAQRVAVDDSGWRTRVAAGVSQRRGAGGNVARRDRRCSRCCSKSNLGTAASGTSAGAIARSISICCSTATRSSTRRRSRCRIRGCRFAALCWSRRWRLPARWCIRRSAGRSSGLLDHLDSGADCVAIVSPDEAARDELAATLCERFGMTRCEPSVDDDATLAARRRRPG